jgi:hypothetical protein
VADDPKRTRDFQLVGDPVEDPARPEAGVGDLPPIDFGTFVLSLSASALVQLGDVPAPGAEEAGAPDLPAARQTIEILDMLREKSRGNLTDEEGRLLDGVLHDLRLRFVEAKDKARS